MANDFLRLTKNIPLSDLISGRITPMEVYQIQVKDWIINPCKHMGTLYPQETDHGMALLAILLIFFEPHGQFLTGEDSQGSSRQKFCLAFNRFLKFLSSKKLVDVITEQDREQLSSLVYRFGRCGLFHSSLMDSSLLVSAHQFVDKVIFRNPIMSGWLVDPWLMLRELEYYVTDYVKAVETDEELRDSFLRTYERLINSHLRRLPIE